MFPIQMTFTVSTESELARLVAAITGSHVAIGSHSVATEDLAADAAQRAANTAAEKHGVHGGEGATKPEPAKKAQKAEAASAAQPADTQATQATTDAAAGDKPIDFTSQIQKPIVAMAAGGRRDEALAILKQLGATKAREIKPEDYARAVELIAKAG